MAQMKFADPGYQPDHKQRYKIDTKKHVRAAWSYINQRDNASRYTSAQRQRIHARIQAAGHRYGIEFGHAREKGATLLGRSGDRAMRRKGLR